MKEEGATASDVPARLDTRPPEERKHAAVLGWREWAGLPELHVPKIKAKVDSGARTSALHASNIELFRRRGTLWARFVIHPRQRSAKLEIHATARVIEERTVRSSMGHATLRPVIRTTIAIGKESWPIEVTLINRDIMGFRMLLGREAIRGRYLIDPGRSYLTRERKPVKRRKSPAK